MFAIVFWLIGTKHVAITLHSLSHNLSGQKESG